MLLQGKIAVITGATRGIGREISLAFLRQGAQVHGIFGSNAAAAAALRLEVQEVVGENAPFTLYQGDVTDVEVVARVTQEIVANAGAIDILVNNAGITRDSFLSRMEDADWDAVLDTNWLGTYHVTVAMLPYLRDHAGASVVNMASVSGAVGREAQTNYATSKGAVIGFTRMLARLHEQRGIRFNTVAPGMIDTEMLGHVPAAKLSNFVTHTTQKRLGTAAETAGAVVFLASELSNYVNSSTIRVDGGYKR